MDNTLKQQLDNVLKEPLYPTPFNVDLFEVKSEDYFTAYIRMVLTLPESIRNILMDSSTADFIEESLGSNFNLTTEQKTEITRIIRDVLLGDLFIGEMAQNISARLRITPDEARKIKDSIVSVLFKPATEDIKKLQTDKFPDKITKSVPEKPDLKIAPEINKNNVVDLRKK